MKKHQEKWRSPSLGKDMTVNIYGDSGAPVIGLPTCGKCADQWEQCGMAGAIDRQLKNGYNQLFCLDTVDEESVLNKKAEPHKRLMRHQQYESFILEEVIPFITQYNSSNYLMIAGVDLGGYHAINLALKNPDKFDKAIGISGIYDIKYFFDDFYNDEVYYNNPVDFMPNLNKQPLLDAIRKIDFRLVTYANDSRKGNSLKMAHIFRKKFIDHQLDIWSAPPGEEWKLWQKMLKKHII